MAAIDSVWMTHYLLLLLIYCTECHQTLQEANSQTEWITCYTIKRMNRSKIDYDLNIIDTPGFGDTRGRRRDDEITKQVENFFEQANKSDIHNVDAVCFVVTPQPRLNATQKYIFDRVLRLFREGKKHNIFILVTYADAAEPPVLAALKEANVPYVDYLKFNNSALFVSNKDTFHEDLYTTKMDRIGHKLNWEMGMQSFKKLFEAIDNCIPPILSNVLDTHIKLKGIIQGLHLYIVRLVDDMQVLKDACKSIDEHKDNIKQNRDFEYSTVEMERIEVPIPSIFMKMATNCLTCKHTCCYPCHVPTMIGMDLLKYMCSGFSRSLKCKVCNHSMSEHERSGEKKFEGRAVNKIKTYKEMIARFNIASDKACDANAVKGNVENELKELGIKTLWKVRQIKDLISKLQNKTLRPTPLTNIDYLNLLIENEKSNGQQGWNNRITAYRKMIKESQFIELAMDMDYSPFNNIVDFLDDMREETDTDVPMEV